MNEWREALIDVIHAAEMVEVKGERNMRLLLFIHDRCNQLIRVIDQFKEDENGRPDDTVPTGQD